MIGKGAGMGHFTRLMAVDGSKSPPRRGGVIVRINLIEEIQDINETSLSNELARRGGENGSHQVVGGGENHRGLL